MKNGEIDMNYLLPKTFIVSTYILFASCENYNFEIFCHCVQELFRKRPNVKDHFQGHILKLFFGRFTAIFTGEALGKLSEVLLLLSTRLQTLLVLDMRMDQRLVQVQHQRVQPGRGW